jgi:hypothetical protein
LKKYFDQKKTAKENAATAPLRHITALFFSRLHLPGVL